MPAGGNVGHLRSFQTEHQPAIHRCPGRDVSDREAVSGHVGLLGETGLKYTERFDHGRASLLDLDRIALGLGQTDPLHDQHRE